MALLVAFVGGWMGCLAVHWLALWRGFVYRPRSRRWNSAAAPSGVTLKERQITLLGGLGIWIGVILTLMLPLPQKEERYYIILLGATAALALGLWDDVKSCSPRAKLLVQGLLGIFVALMGVQVDSLPAILNVPVVVFVVIAGMNMVNLMDNMDGVAGLLSGIAGAGLSILGWLGGDVFITYTGMALVGAAIAFYLYNRPPARMFMGDAGSMMIGYILAVLVLEATNLPYTHAWQRLAVPPLVLGLFVLDTAGVMLWRKLHGHPIMQGDCNHLSHRLARFYGHYARGVPEWWVNAFLGLAQALLITIVLIIARSSSILEAIVWLAVALGGLLSLGLWAWRPALASE